MGVRETLTVIAQLVSDGVVETYAVGGAVAAFNYIQVAATEDLDILISLDNRRSNSGLISLSPIFDHLAAKGYVEFRKEGLVIEGWPVQFLPVASDLDAEGLASAETIEIEPLGAEEPIKIRVLRAEHVVATALLVGRAKDRLRIAQFVEESAVDYDRLRAVLARHRLEGRWRAFCGAVAIDDPCAKGIGS